MRLRAAGDVMSREVGWELRLLLEPLNAQGVYVDRFKYFIVREAVEERLA